MTSSVVEIAVEHRPDPIAIGGLPGISPINVTDPTHLGIEDALPVAENPTDVLILAVEDRLDERDA
jgi:hypothetical protein